MKQIDDLIALGLKGEKASVARLISMVEKDSEQVIIDGIKTTVLLQESKDFEAKKAIVK